MKIKEIKLELIGVLISLNCLKCQKYHFQGKKIMQCNKYIKILNNYEKIIC